MDIDTLLAQTSRYPRRIACLTEEPTETLYRLGCGDLVVGVSSFTLRPEAARHKPKVSSFLDANFDRLLALRPDVVIGFSDLQGDIARELARRSVPVVIFNQRSVSEILQTIQMTGALVGKSGEATALVDEADRNSNVVPRSRPVKAPGGWLHRRARALTKPRSEP